MASDDAMEVEASLPSSPYMDVDSRQHGSASQSIITAAIDEARHAVISFLRMRKAEDIVPTNSRVVMVDSTVRLRHAFRALLDNDVRAAPIIDSATHQYLATLTAADGLDAVLQGLAATNDGTTVGAWCLSRLPDPDAPPPGGFRSVDADDTLLKACTMMRDDALHRVPIVAERTVLCVLDYGRVLRFLHGQLAKRGVAAIPATARSTTGPAGLSSALPHRSDGRDADGGGGGNGGAGRRDHNADSGRGRGDGDGNGSGGDGGGGDDGRRATGAGARLLTLTLAQLELGVFDGVATAHDTDSVSSVLRTLTERNARAVAIVDATTGKLCNVYSRSDAALLACADWGPSVLDGDVGSMLSRLRLPSFELATCRRNDSLAEVFRRFEVSRRHRLFIVDDEFRVNGVLTLCDLLRYFLEGY